MQAVTKVIMRNTTKVIMAAFSEFLNTSLLVLVLLFISDGFIVKCFQYIFKKNAY